MTQQPTRRTNGGVAIYFDTVPQRPMSVNRNREHGSFLSPPFHKGSRHLARPKSSGYQSSSRYQMRSQAAPSPITAEARIQDPRLQNEGTGQLSQGNDLHSTLSHTVNFPLRKGQEREQVYQLAKSLEHMILQEQKSEDIASQGIFKMCQREKNVLDSIFSQALQQVSLTCSERGLLLNELWKRKDVQIKYASKTIESLQQSITFEMESKQQILAELTQHIAELKQKYTTREKRLLEHISLLEEHLDDQEMAVKHLRSAFLQKEDNFLKLVEEKKQAETLPDQNRKETNARLKYRLHVDLLRNRIEHLENSIAVPR